MIMKTFISSALLRSLSEQEQALPHTSTTVISRDLTERTLYLSLNSEVNLVHESVQPLVAVQPLHLRENRLYGIKLWAVRHVEQRGDLEVFVVLLHFACPMNRCTIEEQSKGLSVHLLRECVNEVRVVVGHKWLFLHLKVEHPILSDSSYHVSVVSAHVSLVHSEV